MSSTACAIAAPISAKSTSWRAVAPTSAPRSRTMQALDRVATARRWRTLDARHGLEDELGDGHQGAGVTGEDDEGSASASCTASSVSHMLDERPRRTACLARCIDHGVGVDDARMLGQLRDAARDMGACAPDRRTAGSSRRDGGRGRWRPRHHNGRALVPPMALSEHGFAVLLLTPHAHLRRVCPGPPSGRSANLDRSAPENERR